MVRTKEELMNALTAVIGENTSDEAITLIEDVADTLATLADAENWRARAEEIDADWRRKYIERFTSGAEAIEETVEEVAEEPMKTDFSELFEEV